MTERFAVTMYLNAEDKAALDAMSAALEVSRGRIAVRALRKVLEKYKRRAEVQDNKVLPHKV